MPPHGGRKSCAIFLEASIPIFSEKNAIGGFHALTSASLDVMKRYNDTNVAVQDRLRWHCSTTPTRGSWGKGFRGHPEELYSAHL